MPISSTQALQRNLATVASAASLPDEVTRAIETVNYLGREAGQSASTTTPPNIADQIIEAVDSTGTLPKALDKQIADHHTKAAVDKTRAEILREAADRAGNRLQGIASQHADEITERLDAVTQEALSCLPEVAGLIPEGFSDAEAFHSSAEVQEAWRKLGRAANVVTAVLAARKAMTNPRGGSQPLDYAEVFTDPSWGGGTRYGLVSNVREVVAAGGFDGPADMPMPHRLLSLHRAGVTFRVSTGAEIAEMIARDVAQTKKDETPGFAGMTPRRAIRVASF